MHPSKTVIASCAALTLSCVVGTALIGVGPSGAAADVLPAGGTATRASAPRPDSPGRLAVTALPTLMRPAKPSTPLTAAAYPPQTVQATVEPNASQAVLIPVPSDNDFGTIPLISSNTPNLVVAGAWYSGDQTNLVVSAVNVFTDRSTGGQLDVAGWGVYDAVVAPNPSQSVYVDVPTGYNTSTVPVVTSEDPNLMLFSATYAYVGNTPQLVIDVGNPFPATPVTGDLRIDW